MREEKATTPRWEEFHRWERAYEMERLRGLTPAQKIEICQELFQAVLRIREEKVRSAWGSDEEEKESPHIQYWINLRKSLLKGS
ncbi:hypothetical protein HKBW3S06_00112 [Candidatus Hakubella thermalkaliphila]|uniref:Uncharacterized protein n=1 Tax=Candidatus Hakubella thermalkaliphila TaxID=2754717 RepID=A0A6V8NKZ1_9ACTN|nr:hypothetical protein [Candidatus Hakubella thermalkaliphila]GFP20885.1 hypothetical protein HKBW3S06_00112 [Candidatus Hakubella thermalkaliphila]GFP41164.1 hypothetical protein HKBW3C_00290 [Candidatus Hakubella thermalkaliphila]